MDKFNRHFLTPIFLLFCFFGVFAQAQNPQTAESHFNNGIALAKAGRVEEAIEAYKQAIRIKPDHFDAHSNLGQLYFREKRYTEAIGAYKQAIRLKPKYS